MTEPTHRPCPYRSEQPVGELFCKCKGKPLAYLCHHPEVAYYVMLNNNELKRRAIRKPDGKVEKLRKEPLQACITCPFRPNLSDSSELPSLAQQAANFAVAIAKFAASGFDTTGPEDYDRRIVTCADCSSITEEARCKHCGCWVSEKALWRTEDCPEGKW